MNWKREAADKLRNYEVHKQALENLPREIRRLESSFAGIRSATTDRTPVSGGSCTREDMMLSNITHREELKRRLREARLWVSIVDGGLSVLDEEERLVLERLFIHPVKGAMKSLSEQLHIDNTTVSRRRDSALRRFTIALYGVQEAE